MIGETTKVSFFDRPNVEKGVIQVGQGIPFLHWGDQKKILLWSHLSFNYSLLLTIETPSCFESFGALALRASVGLKSQDWGLEQ